MAVLLFKELGYARKCAFFKLKNNLHILPLILVKIFRILCHKAS